MTVHTLCTGRMSLVQDTLSFCHPPTALGFYFGFVQFLPVVILTAAFLTAWRTREIIFTLYFYCINIIYFLVYALQETLGDPIPNPLCTNVWGSAYGLPALDASIVASYFVYVMGYHLLWNRHISSHLALVSTGLFLLPSVSLYVNGLNTLWQIAAGLLLGGAVSAVYLAIIRTVFVPYVISEVVQDVHGLALLLGQRDTYLQFDGRVEGHGSKQMGVNMY